ncbi:MAG: outer membrane protein assembly factor BamD [Chthoniobacterales bacterium]
MLRSATILTLICLIGIGAMLPAAAQQAPATTNSTAYDPAAAAAFDQAVALEEAGDYNSAVTAHRSLLKNYPYEPQAAESQFRLAQISQAGGHLPRAFNEFSTYISRYPDGKHFDEAISQQVAIANTYLDGKKTRVLGITVNSGYSRAQKMYSSILESAPFSKYAPMAQFNLGLAYEKQGKVQEAVNNYQKVLDSYPNSSVADDALYQIAYVNMRAGFGQGSQDLSALRLAQHTFEDFLYQFPNSEKAPQAEANLKLIHSREAGDLLNIARFYDHKKEFRAAAIYYNDIIRREPNSEDAEFARTRIEELRSDLGDDALRSGPERTDTGERVAVRRRLQAQVETSALANYVGPPVRDIETEELPVVRPRLRSGVNDVSPLPAVEPQLPVE